MAIAAGGSTFIEDPDVGRDGLAALAGAEDLFSWDAPIHSVADIEGLAQRPGAINIKPSRFGSLRRLLDAIEYCAAAGIPVYGGGQFELGVGRDQIQAVAATFYPHAANDVAPRDYNQGDPRPGLPASPLAPPSRPRPASVFCATDVGVPAGRRLHRNRPLEQPQPQDICPSGQDRPPAPLVCSSSPQWALGGFEGGGASKCRNAGSRRGTCPRPPAVQLRRVVEGYGDAA